MSQIPQSPLPQDPQPSSTEPGMPPAVTPVETNKDARLWGMLCHLSAFAAFVLPALGSIIGPLVVWLIKKNEYPFVDRNGKESLNWQITMMIGFLISAPLTCIGIGFFTAGALAVVDIVFTIIAAIKANDGLDYKYPWSIKLIK